MSDENEKQDRPSKAPGSAVAKSAVVRPGAQRGQRMLPLVVWSCLLMFQLGVLCGFLVFRVDEMIQSSGFGIVSNNKNES